MDPSISYSQLHAFDSTRPQPFDLRARACWIGPAVIELDYLLKVDLKKIKIPAEINEPGRADNLWETTCFEAFIGNENSKSYFEVNLSTSGEWNVYEFSDYRKSRIEADQVHCNLESIISKTSLNLKAQINLNNLDIFKNKKIENDWILGLTAVIEMADGLKSYCALTHKSEKPDFHVKDSFILRLKRNSTK